MSNSVVSVITESFPMVVPMPGDTVTRNIRCLQTLNGREVDVGRSLSRWSPESVEWDTLDITLGDRREPSVGWGALPVVGVPSVYRMARFDRRTDEPSAIRDLAALGFRSASLAGHVLFTFQHGVFGLECGPVLALGDYPHFEKGRRMYFAIGRCWLGGPRDVAYCLTDTIHERSYALVESLPQ